MKETGKRNILSGLTFVASFAIFTYLVQVVDVKPLGVNGSDIGFSALNCGVHQLCGVHMTLYTLTDWAGLVPILVAFAFGVLGLFQLVKGQSLVKVDADILVLGVYYMVVAAFYVVFERIPINYRPILINGFMENSYPSSTTLLVLSVMPTLAEQVHRRCKNPRVRVAVLVATTVFSVLMVVGRLLSGVHWLTDILGAILISTGLFQLYKGFVLRFYRLEA